MQRTYDQGNQCQASTMILMDMLEQAQFSEATFKSLCLQYPNCEGTLKELLATWQELDQISIPEPSPQMTNRFYDQLIALENEEQEKLTVSKSPKVVPINRYRWIQWVGVAAVFLIGLTVGRFSFSSPGNGLENTIVALDPVQDLSKQTYVALKNTNSASERLRGIQMVKTMEEPNDLIVTALNQALLFDPNINVRLSAIETMVQFAEAPKVRENLIRAIPQQTSPLVQLALAEAMIELEEKSAVDELEQLMESEEVEIEVKKELAKTVKILM